MHKWFYLYLLSLKTNMREKRRNGEIMKLINCAALTVAIIGALNWGSIGLFGFDAVAWIGGSQMAVFSRIVYTIVALAGIWCISMLFRPADETVVSRD